MCIEKDKKRRGWGGEERSKIYCIMIILIRPAKTHWCTQRKKKREKDKNKDIYHMDAVCPNGLVHFKISML